MAPFWIGRGGRRLRRLRHLDNTATGGQDFTGQTGTAQILAGATTTTVDVPVLDDSTYEGDETLNLDLTGSVNGSVVDAQGQGTITEDDPAPTISVDGPSVAEGGGTLTFTVSIDAAAAVDTSVDYATSDGTATDGQDYGTDRDGDDHRRLDQHHGRCRSSTTRCTSPTRPSRWTCRTQ